MAGVLLTKRIEFAAAHRYHNPAWGPDQNRKVFGACFNEPGHGHNYLLEVTITGDVDEVTGMVVNLYDLKRVLEEVLEEFDHKHLNLDTPYFRDVIPTTENIARVLWRIMAARRGIGTLQTIRLFEDEDLYAECTSGLAEASHGAQARARVNRRYHFASAHALYADRLSADANRAAFGPCAGRAAHGHNYALEIAVVGPIDPQSGMVVPLSDLDSLVQKEVLERFDRHDLNQDRAFRKGHLPSGENVVRVIWDLLATGVEGLERIRLVESRERVFEYAGGNGSRAKTSSEAGGR